MLHFGRTIDLLLSKCFFAVKVLIVVVIQIQILRDGPVTELVEQNLTSSVAIALSPLCLNVSYINLPLRHQVLGLFELLKADSPVFVLIDPIERNEVLIILSKVLEQIAVLGLFNIVTTMLRF